MKTTTRIDGFCRILTHTETAVTDNGQCGEDACALYTALEAKTGHRIWYSLDSDQYRVPITGLVKQNCAILLLLHPTSIKQILGDIMELRLIAKPSEIKWITDRIKDASKRIERG